MLHAFALALAQLADPALRRIWFKSMAVTVLAFVAISAGIWFGADWAMQRAGIDDQTFADAEGLRGLIAIIAALIGGWLLWRLLALAVLQMFADEVVEAVEARNYPVAAAAARPIGWREEARRGVASAARALVWNLLALPVALVLIWTGIGPALVFLAVNAVLLGRELQDMVWLRHRTDAKPGPPLSPLQRLALGGIVTAMLAIPVANLFAPFLGAAAATHLIHRKDLCPHA